MSTRPNSPRDPSRSASTSVDLVSDVVDSVKAYAVQETVGPIKGAFRWVGVGLLAALCLGIATLYGSMAVLRLSQDLGGTALDGAWSFVHYLITVLVLVVVVGVSYSRTKKSSLARGA